MEYKTLQVGLLAISIYLLVKITPVFSFYFDNRVNDSSWSDGSSHQSENSMSGQGNKQHNKKDLSDKSVRNSFNSIDINVYAPDVSVSNVEEPAQQQPAKVQSLDRPVFNSQGGRGQASSVMSSY